MPPKLFPASVQRVLASSSLDLLDYLGHGSVDRHVFDPDGVCHVGEMISAPADVLKGAAGKVNHSAKAKAWPAIHIQTHTHAQRHARTKTECVSMAAEIYVYSAYSHTKDKTDRSKDKHTVAHEHLQADTHKKKKLFSVDGATGANTYTRLSPFTSNSFKHLQAHRDSTTQTAALSHTCIIGTVTCSQNRCICDSQQGSGDPARHRPA